MGNFVVSCCLLSCHALVHFVVLYFAILVDVGDVMREMMREEGRGRSGVQVVNDSRRVTLETLILQVSVA